MPLKALYPNIYILLKESQLLLHKVANCCPHVSTMKKRHIIPNTHYYPINLSVPKRSYLQPCTYLWKYLLNLSLPTPSPCKLYDIILLYHVHFYPYPPQHSELCSAQSVCPVHISGVELNMGYLFQNVLAVINMV